ncbi:MAG: hypothetical protein PHQ65_12020 [Bacteroidales bacterium]|nr:hypothetical protein [Bacteroidales bacterium]MDD3665984.1 hypothetical protein [Bacteroidales bacterium]
MMTSEKAEKNRLIRIIHVLLRETGLEQRKCDLLEGYGVEHTNELSVDQMRGLAAWLLKHRDGTNAQIRAARSQVLSQLQRIGIYTDNRDWAQVNHYLMQPRIAGKLLYQMDIAELEALSVKLRAIERKTELKTLETHHLTRNN